VAQLEQFLTSSGTAKLSDDEIADRLSKVELSEQLAADHLNRIYKRTTPGPATYEQLQLLAAASVFLSPPKADVSSLSPPDQPAQDQVIDAARQYARQGLHLVPDLLAMRDTRAFDNRPIETNSKRIKPKVQMHFESESKREVAVRNGKEVNWSLTGHEDTNDSISSTGLQSSGEFGAFLALILNDSFHEHLVWDRWQRSESGTLVAVFRYAIPRSSSHYTVDFCCYRKSQDDPQDYPFKDKPGYHGEIYIRPENGEIDRITLEAEFGAADPVAKSAIAVEYGQVTIGGKPFVCPVRSVAISELHNPAIEKINSIGIVRHVNLVEFTGSHVFGSNARILTDAVRTPQQ